MAAGRAASPRTRAPPWYGALLDEDSEDARAGGTRVHRRQGCPGAQPGDRVPRDPEARAGRLHWRLRLGQIVPGLRHHLRRGAAAVRRVALLLRPAVPGPDGEAQVRPHPRPLADDRDRAEDGLVEPAL